MFPEEALRKEMTKKKTLLGGVACNIPSKAALVVDQTSLNGSFFKLGNIEWELRSSHS